MLDDLPFVERHAWFSAYEGLDDWNLNSGLIGTDGGLTEVGAAFKALAATVPDDGTPADGGTPTDGETPTDGGTPPADGLTAVDDRAATAEDTPLTVAVLANDRGAEPFWIAAAATSHGAVAANADGTLTFTPEEGFLGTAAVTYGISDGSSSDTGELLVDVVAARAGYTLGTAQDDQFSGGRRSDLYAGADGADTLKGNSGNDMLFGENGDDFVYGGSGHDTLGGNAGDDMLSGDSGDDTLLGSGGDDLLLGGDGRDVLNGGGGRDALDGGRGDDRMTGGPGPDIFTVGRNLDSDTITDFDPAEDRLQFQGNPRAIRYFDVDGDRSIDTVIDFGRGDKATLLNVEYIA